MRYLWLLMAFIILLPLSTEAAQTINVNEVQINVCSTDTGLEYCTKADESNSIMALLNYRQQPDKQDTKLQKFNNGVSQGTNTIVNVADSIRSIGGFFGGINF